VAATEALSSIDFMLGWLKEMLKGVSIEEITEVASKRILDNLLEVFSQKHPFEEFFSSNIP
jgi:hypothetical protein